MTEGTEEHAGFGIAEQGGDIRGRQVAFAQVAFRQLPAGVGEQLLITAAFLRQSALQRALAQAQFAGNRSAARFPAGQLLTQEGDDTAADAGAGQPGEQASACWRSRSRSGGLAWGSGASMSALGRPMA